MFVLAATYQFTDATSDHFTYQILGYSCEIPGCGGKEIIYAVTPADPIMSYPSYTCDSSTPGCDKIDLFPSSQGTFSFDV